MPSTPPSRRLLASTVALLLLFAFTALLYVERHRLGGWMTRFGLVAPFDLIAVAVAMTAGGYIARGGFRALAVGFVLLVGIASAITAWGYAPPEQTGAARWLLRNTALQLALSCGVAWAAAHLGQRFATRRARATAD